MTSETWTETDIPDVTGKRAVVTGATAGLGRATAETLAAKGAEVILAVRDTARGEKLAAEIRTATPGATISVRKLDLASLASIEAFANGLAGEVDRLDLLVDNAGVMIPPLGHTEDGFELQMGTNHFGHFALTGRLFPLLSATPGARVAVTSSLAHRQGKPDLDDLDWHRRRYRAMQAYSDSKIANLLFAYELARRLDGTGPMIVASHPGVTATELLRDSPVMRFASRLMAMPLHQGVMSQLRAATDSEATSLDYFGPDGWFELRGRPVRVEPVPRARDPELARRLWEISVARTGVDFGGIGREVPSPAGKERRAGR